jgi:hypothetical protein
MSFLPIVDHQTILNQNIEIIVYPILVIISINQLNIMNAI